MAIHQQDCARGGVGPKERRIPLAVGMASLALLTLFAPATALAGDAASASNTFTAALARGPVFAVAAAFVGGLLVSLTPCVYPMIAITVSVFGANQSKSRLQAAGLSSIFVLGIAVMFTALGVGVLRLTALADPSASAPFAAADIVLFGAPSPAVLAATSPQATSPSPARTQDSTPRGEGRPNLCARSVNAIERFFSQSLRLLNPATSLNFSCDA